MPIFEYQCDSCGEQFEELVRWSAPPEEIECPGCGSRHRRKLVSLTAAVGRSSQASTAACAPSGGG